MTLLLVLALSGCVYGRYVESLYQDPCNSRAYIQLVVEDYLNKRFPLKSPVRMAIIPFSVPANLASSGNESPGLGNELAWKIHAYLLETGSIPMLEVFNRVDWPGKKDEFFTGNYGALALAREAGYDLVMVGYLDQVATPARMSVQTKLIEVESGITVYYGKTSAENYDARYQRRGPWWLPGSFWWHSNEEPSQMLINSTTDQLAHCVVRSLLSYEPVPN
ncbi:MAG: hypothetical protein GX589_05880 [Deltaproteobacteria bacterium]|nr:hypothetical protein [Deltaproteobacteria bacterium]